jgi:hypothetical protein
MPGRVIGVSKSSLWLAWKEIRVQLRSASVRDVIDFLDYDIEPDVWITRLLRQISLGAYEPDKPLRFPVAKSPSFKRILTFPGIPDLVLYRAIADHIHRRASKISAATRLLPTGRFSQGRRSGAARRRARDATNRCRLQIYVFAELPKLAELYSIPKTSDSQAQPLHRHRRYHKLFQ